MLSSVKLNSLIRRRCHASLLQHKPFVREITHQHFFRKKKPHSANLKSNSFVTSLESLITASFKQTVLALHFSSPSTLILKLLRWYPQRGDVSVLWQAWVSHLICDQCQHHSEDTAQVQMPHGRLQPRSAATERLLTDFIWPSAACLPFRWLQDPPGQWHSSPPLPVPPCSTPFTTVL